MKIAYQLRISQEEHDALVKVRDLLASGCIAENARRDYVPRFDMNHTARSERGCGTACCIGGWVATLMGDDRPNKNGRLKDVTEWHATRYVRAAVNHETLHRLYYPWSLGGKWEEITPQEGAQAITNFLETGDPDWSSVTRERLSR